MALILQEHLSFNRASMVVESEGDHEKKSLYMKGIFIQGNIRNHNERIYPVHEIKKAVDTLNKQIKDGSVCGELDHPEDLKINLDRVSHEITQMWMEGNDGYGKLKIVSTPMGNIAKTLLESGVKLGVSSRGSGNVSETDGRVSDFEIITVDIVAQPSAPSAFPRPIYESIINMKHGHRLIGLAKEAKGDKQVQRFLKEEVIRLIRELKI